MVIFHSYYVNVYQRVYIHIYIPDDGWKTPRQLLLVPWSRLGQIAHLGAWPLVHEKGFIPVIKDVKIVG